MKTNWLQRFLPGPAQPATAPTQARADGGNAEAQFALGLQYANAPEVDGQGYALAAQWYLKAAEQGHALAQFSLAQLYAEGRGVDQDDVESAHWLEKAARQGHAGAQFSLGMTHRIAGLQRKPANASESRIAAYTWLQLAAAQGYQGSVAACEQVNLHMSWAEVAVGNERAATIRAQMPTQPRQAR